MKRHIIRGAALAAVLVAAGANAASITNLEPKPHTVKIISADQEEIVTLSPSEKVSIDHLCPAECVVLLQSGDEYEVTKHDDILLEDGGLYFEPVAQGSGVTEAPRPQ